MYSKEIRKSKAKFAKGFALAITFTTAVLMAGAMETEDLRTKGALPETETKSAIVQTVVIIDGESYITAERETTAEVTENGNGYYDILNVK